MARRPAARSIVSALISGTRETLSTEESLVQAGFPQRGVVRPETKALVVARDRDDAAIAQHFGDTKIIDNVVIVIFTAGCRANIACVRSRLSRRHFLPVNNGCANAKRRPDRRTVPEIGRASCRERV